METIRYAWRNLWRNARRSTILLVAMSASMAALVVLFALDRGLSDDFIGAATRTLEGEAQVHGKGYRASRSIYDTVHDPEAVLAAAKTAGLDAAPRAIGTGLLSHGNRSAGALLYGIDPAPERALGDLATRVESGSFLPATASKQVVLGGTLARTLGVTTGGEIVVVVQAADGSIGNDLFHVAGVLASIGDEVDRETAFIDRADFGALFADPGDVHEIALTSHGRLPSSGVAAAVRPSADGNDVATWEALLPAVAEFGAMMRGVNWLMSVLFICAGGLGVLNSMLMAQFERIPEFGLVKALGATPARVVREVVAESTLLGVIAVGAGAAVGIAASMFLAHHPIDLSGFGKFSSSGVAFTGTWRARLTSLDVFVPALTVVLTAFVGAIQPAIKAARLDPVEALEHV